MNDFLIITTHGFRTIFVHLHIARSTDTRVNFVGHGADLKQEGAQSLANKVKILQQTYGNDSTDIRRIALVGCGTDGVYLPRTLGFFSLLGNNI
jgi:hypothetical protein